MKRDNYVCEWLFAVKLYVSIAGCNHVDGFAAAGVKHETVCFKVKKTTKKGSYQLNMKRDNCMCERLFAVKLCQLLAAIIFHMTAAQKILTIIGVKELTTSKQDPPPYPYDLESFSFY